jgi:CHAD domain-containing protein
MMELDYVKLKDVKPALSCYVREALFMLKQNPVPDEKVVHDVRVLMKKARAVMRLISSQTEQETFIRNYEAFREVGRIMRSWRDSSVHRKTLKELKKQNPDIFSLMKDNVMLEAMLRKDPIPAEPSQEVRDDLEKIEELLGKAGFRIRFQNMSGFDPKILIKELDSTYNSVVDKYLICRNNLKPSDIHKFRKRAKDFLYQLYFFRPLNPSVIKTLEKKLDSMTQNLGRYNDLAQLILTIEYKYSASANSPLMDELAIIIRGEQDKHLSKVWSPAYKLFCPGQKLVNLLGFRLLVI